MSKGSTRRKEDIAKIWDNWDQIFGKKSKEDKPVQPDKKDTK